MSSHLQCASKKISNQDDDLKDDLNSLSNQDYLNTILYSNSLVFK